MGGLDLDVSVDVCLIWTNGTGDGVEEIDN